MVIFKAVCQTLSGNMDIILFIFVKFHEGSSNFVIQFKSSEKYKISMEGVLLKL